MQSIRFGILGTGSIATSFAKDSAAVPAACLGAVASRDLGRANAFAQRFNVAKAYSDYAAMCADPNLDAIYVATPHNFHARDSIAALRAGKAVLCEKPLTVNVAEFDQLQRVAKETGCYLMEGMWSYFLPAVRRAKAWLDAGLVGRLCHINASFGFNVPYEPTKRMYSPELAGGTLLDMGIYPLAFAWLATKQNPASMQVVGRFSDTGVEDDVSVLFDYGDVTAALTSSMRCRLSNTAEWIGTEGKIVIPNFWFANECRLEREDAVIDRFFEPRASFGLNYELDAMCADLTAGRTSSKTVPLETSRVFQTQLGAIRAKLKG